MKTEAKKHARFRFLIFLQSSKKRKARESALKRTVAVHLDCYYSRVRLVLLPGVRADGSSCPGGLADEFSVKRSTVQKTFYWLPSRGKTQAKGLVEFQGLAGCGTLLYGPFS